MHQKRAESLLKPVKPSSVHTEGERSDAREEYRAEQEAVRERMARQRQARLSAQQLISRKNRAPG